MKFVFWAAAVIAISASFAQASVLNMEPSGALFPGAGALPAIVPVFEAATPPEAAPLLAGGLGVLGFAALSRKRRAR